MNKVISFDMMKLTKDTINSQPSDTLFQNILSLVKNNFPGVTHIAISVPINANADFVSYGNNPSPRTVESFTDFLLDEIHNMGYNVLLRGTDCYGENIYNFGFKPQTAQEWANEISPYLTAHKAHLKSGDIIGVFPEFEGQNNGFGANVTDSWDSFYKTVIAAVKGWATETGINVSSATTINESEANSGWYGQDLVALNGEFIVDYYPDASLTNESQWISNFKATVDNLHTKYAPQTFPVFVQETADTRNPNTGATQASDPQMLADCFTQVIYPYLESGEMSGINFWNLFDTPQEGIITIDGNSVSLNPKGQALAKAFQSLVSPNPTPPDPTPIPPNPTPTPAVTEIAPTGTQVHGNVYLHEVTVGGTVIGSVEILH